MDMNSSDSERSSSEDETIASAIKPMKRKRTKRGDELDDGTGSNSSCDNRDLERRRTVKRRKEMWANDLASLLPREVESWFKCIPFEEQTALGRLPRTRRQTLAMNIKSMNCKDYTHTTTALAVRERDVNRKQQMYDNMKDYDSSAEVRLENEEWIDSVHESVASQCVAEVSKEADAIQTMPIVANCSWRRRRPVAPVVERAQKHTELSPPIHKRYRVQVDCGPMGSIYGERSAETKMPVVMPEGLDEIDRGAPSRNAPCSPLPEKQTPVFVPVVLPEGLAELEHGASGRTAPRLPHRESDARRCAPSRSQPVQHTQRSDANRRAYARQRGRRYEDKQYECRRYNQDDEWRRHELFEYDVHHRHERDDFIRRLYLRTRSRH